jgi:hypothetical protein
VRRGRGECEVEWKRRGGGEARGGAYVSEKLVVGHTKSQFVRARSRASARCAKLLLLSPAHQVAGRKGTKSGERRRKVGVQSCRLLSQVSGDVKSVRKVGATGVTGQRASGNYNCLRDATLFCPDFCFGISTCRHRFHSCVQTCG